MAQYPFPKRSRLLRGEEFDMVFAARASAADDLLVLYGAANRLGYPRLGLAVSRRCGGAVQRNRWKRILREAFRSTQRELPALDLVCVPRADSVPELRRLVASLPALAARVEGKLGRRKTCVEEDVRADATTLPNPKRQAN
jgi:ribonuclease P protein component